MLYNINKQYLSHARCDTFFLLFNAWEIAEDRF